MIPNPHLERRAGTCQLNGNTPGRGRACDRREQSKSESSREPETEGPWERQVRSWQRLLFGALSTKEDGLFHPGNRFKVLYRLAMLSIHAEKYNCCWKFVEEKSLKFWFGFGKVKVF